MQKSARPAGSGLLEVDLNSCPTHLSEGYERNRQWNVRTLNLMAWAGDQAPRRRASGQERLRVCGGMGSPARRVLCQRGGPASRWRSGDGRTSAKDHWQQAVGAQRAAAAAEQRAALDQMHAVLRGDRCVAEILAAYYRANWHGGVLTTVVNCRNCPWCRAHRRTRPRWHVPGRRRALPGRFLLGRSAG